MKVLALVFQLFQVMALAPLEDLANSCMCANVCWIQNTEWGTMSMTLVFE